MLNSESIVIILIKGEHLLYSKISGGMIGYGWGNVCNIVNFPPGEYLLYSKVYGGKVYYTANIPRGNVYYVIVNIPGEGCYAEGLLCDTGMHVQMNCDIIYPSGVVEVTPGFNGVCVTRSLVLFVCLVDRCLSFCVFSFGHCIVCPSSLY